MIARVAFASIALTSLGACDGCKRGDAPGPSSSPAASASASAALVSASASIAAEALPRCRVDGASVTIPGEDVLVGDAAMHDKELLVGVARKTGDKRVLSVVRVPLDLASIAAVDVAPARGDDPPPSPRVHPRTGQAFVAFHGRVAGADRSRARTLTVARLDAGGLGKVEGVVTQQADESTAFDLAWPLDDAAGAGPPLVAWDEDAPIPEGEFVASRGELHVQTLGAPAPADDKTRGLTVTPYPSDAEAPKLLARRGGYWLAWIARRSEGEDAGAGMPEGAGEARANRWVEAMTLDAKGKPTSAIRRVSSDKGRVAAIALSPAEGDVDLVVLAQDDAATREGAGGRVFRFEVPADPAAKRGAIDLVDGGIGHAIADLDVPGSLAWTDAADHAHVLPLGARGDALGQGVVEPALEGARVLAGHRGMSGATLFTVDANATIRKLSCSP